MDYLQRMNDALDYIENNLDGEIDYEIAASKACCSVFYFQRMFSFIADVTLSEYIRRRRLTLAAFELQNSKVKIIDLAVKYGYDSPDSFTRAFQNSFEGNRWDYIDPFYPETNSNSGDASIHDEAFPVYYDFTDQL